MDDGPELGADAVATTELLLVVKPIRDDFGIPTMTHHVTTVHISNRKMLKTQTNSNP